MNHSIIALAMNGNPESQYALAEMLFDDENVNNYGERSAIWYAKAAEQGHAEAQSMLGCLYFYGCGVEGDYKKAVYWLRKAAAQGIEEAEEKLIVAIERLAGEYYDLKKYEDAFSLYREAAEKGMFNETYAILCRLASMYYDGYGTEKNFREAYIWYYVCYLEYGETEEIMLGLNRVKGCLSEQEIEEAKSQAQEKKEEIFGPDEDYELFLHDED